MRSKKFILSFIILAGIFCIVLLQSSAPPPPAPPGIPAFEQEPPVVKSYRVQKLAHITPTGGTMIMKIEYYPDSRLTDTMGIYYDAGSYVMFRDNGVSPDVTANDYIYTAYLNENVTAFRSTLLSLQSSLSSAGTFLHFTGHVGEEIDFSTVGAFPVDSFDAGYEVGVGIGYILDAPQCEGSLLKQNSLFITDLDVVENLVRTNKVHNGQGNPTGVWTFGNLVKNMAHVSVTGVSAQQLLKNWMKRWAYGATINGQYVPPRTEVYRHLIGPWIKKAGYSYLVTHYGVLIADNYSNDSITVAANWEDDWDHCSEAALLQNAPFKLTAIVNRIDVRGNLAYNPFLNNGGEIRFIYSLIAPEPQHNGNVVPDVAAGMPPIGGDGAGGPGYPCASMLDWQGMNVILEYGIPIQNRCDLQAYARGWMDLSALALGTESYNAALEALTHAVIDSGAAPANVNGSALLRLRTNERLFFESRCGASQGSTWEPSDWELSQFELDNSTHCFAPVPVTNTPMNITNAAGAYGLEKSGIAYNNGAIDNSSLALIDWLYYKKQPVLQGNFNMPTSWTYGGDQFKLAATAIIDAEQPHFWALNWTGGNTTYYTTIDTSAGRGSDPEAQKLRLQFALNTCHGCHAGETKTLFTQVRPLGYGQAARYWIDADTPDYDFRVIDIRFGLNTSLSKLNSGPAEMNHYFSPTTMSDSNYYVRIAPFLTGRDFSGAGTYDDDKREMNEDLSDQSFNGDHLYYVYEPTNLFNDGNNTDQSLPKDQRFNGFNDLERRKKDLCLFVNSACGKFRGSVFWSIATATTFSPLPIGSH